MKKPYSVPVAVTGPRMFGGVLCKWETMASRPSAELAINFHTKRLEPAVDEITRTTEGTKVYWHVGLRKASDGCYTGGGMIFKTKRAAVAAWEASAPAPKVSPKSERNAPWA